ncbi:hypothetical protein SARC_03751 [Sphaeroforma arctica JP610]|uniref:Uncharacterized protein n=1 Tax=Sphaeroforma arctica JP610 TaxID=667725 RepID=A0A0L0G4K9_9EUKA|nr:hypothetical protein SARC_03751 [Sphaeroforma arctica JP610]KNC84017.1 hypothetical protein SARC_03751 [Sphaeroforma arctica JP610]|eukprot:XP_014157919.1 hypothetical protein SARC_03751 [Sphaeroforma arctica JP610]
MRVPLSASSKASIVKAKSKAKEVIDESQPAYYKTKKGFGGSYSMVAIPRLDDDMAAISTKMEAQARPKIRGQRPITGSEMSLYKQAKEAKNRREVKGHVTSASNVQRTNSSTNSYLQGPSTTASSGHNDDAADAITSVPIPKKKYSLDGLLAKQENSSITPVTDASSGGDPMDIDTTRTSPLPWKKGDDSGVESNGNSSRKVDGDIGRRNSGTGEKDKERGSKYGQYGSSSSSSGGTGNPSGYRSSALRREDSRDSATDRDVHRGRDRGGYKDREKERPRDKDHHRTSTSKDRDRDRDSYRAHRERDRSRDGDRLGRRDSRDNERYGSRDSRSGSRTESSRNEKLAVPAPTPDDLFAATARAPRRSQPPPQSTPAAHTAKPKYNGGISQRGSTITPTLTPYHSVTPGAKPEQSNTTTSTPSALDTLLGIKKANDDAIDVDKESRGATTDVWPSLLRTGTNDENGPNTLATILCPEDLELNINVISAPVPASVKSVFGFRSAAAKIRDSESQENTPATAASASGEAGANMTETKSGNTLGPRGTVGHLGTLKIKKKAVRVGRIQFEVPGKLERVKYFERDETPKQFYRSVRGEQAGDGQAIKRKHNVEALIEQQLRDNQIKLEKKYRTPKVEWSAPPLLDLSKVYESAGDSHVLGTGQDSLEREVQRIRENTEMSATYLADAQVPPNPAPPSAADSQPSSGLHTNPPTMIIYQLDAASVAAVPNIIEQAQALDQGAVLNTPNYVADSPGPALPPSTQLPNRQDSPMGYASPAMTTVATQTAPTTNNTTVDQSDRSASSENAAEPENQNSPQSKAPLRCSAETNPNSSFTRQSQCPTSRSSTTTSGFKSALHAPASSQRVW